MHSLARRLPLYVVVMLLVGLIQPALPESFFGAPSSQALAQDVDASTAGTPAATEEVTETATEPIEPTETASATETEVVVETGSLVIFRTDDAANPIPGACFVLIAADGSQIGPACEVDGVVRFDNVSAGGYTLRETTTPTGVVAAADQYVDVVANQSAEIRVVSAVVPTEVPVTQIPTESPATPTPTEAVTETVVPTETVAPTKEIAPIATPKPVKRPALVQPLSNADPNCNQIPNAITGLTAQAQDATTGDLSDVLYYWQNLYIRGTFDIPDEFGNCDYFQLQLPAELRYSGSFELKQGDDIVANAVVDANGLVTFTLTAFTDLNDNVEGFFYFTADVREEQVTWGSEHTFTFTGDVTVDFNVTVPTGEEPGPSDPEQNPYKGGWVNETNLTFRASTGILTNGGTYTITDYANDWTINCSTVHVVYGNQFDMYGHVSGPNDVWFGSSGAVNITCSEGIVTASGSLAPGEAAMLYFQTNDVAPGYTYSNTATVTTSEDGTKTVSASVTVTDAGGGATGNIKPVAPTVGAQSCNGGTWVPPTITAATTPSGVRYSSASATVNGDVVEIRITAQRASGQTWDTMPAGWTVDTSNDRYAQYFSTIPYIPCDTPVVPVTPTITGNVCEGGAYVPPTVVPGTGPEGVTYTNGSATGVTITIDATLSAGQVWGTLPTGWTVDSSNASIAHYSGTYTEAPCAPVVPVAPTIEGNVCRGGFYWPPVLVLPQSTESISYNDGSAANGTMTATASVKNGYAWDAANMPEGWTISTSDPSVANYSGTYVEAPCAPVVPVTPTIAGNVCEGGAYTSPTVQFGETDGVTYSNGTASGGQITATATLANGFAWDTANMPEGWTIVPSDPLVANYVGTYTEAPCVPATPIVPTITGNVCEGGAYTPPTVQFGETEGVIYSDGVASAGQITATATLTDGYAWDADNMPEGWTVDPSNPAISTYLGSYVEAPCAPVIPAMPVVNQAVCTGGELIDPTVTTVDTDRITYTSEGDVVPGGTVTITATLTDGFEWDEAMPAGWTINPENPTEATFVVTLDDVDCTPIVPMIPTISGNVCVDGAYTPPTVQFGETDGVTYSNGTTASGTITATATLADGYAWDTANMPTGWSVDPSNPAVATYNGTYTEAPCVPVVPVNPSVTPAVCVDDKVVPPSIELPTTPGITYTVDGTPTAGGKVTVTATLDDGYSWGELPSGWVKTSDTTATLEVTFTNVTCEVPSTPTPTPPTTPVTRLPETGSGQGNGFVWFELSLIAIIGAAGILVRKSVKRG